MFSILDEEWDLSDVAQVSIRKVNFGMDAAQWTTCCLLRRAWTFIPPTPDCTDVGPVMKKDQGLSDKEREKIPLNPDKKTIHNPWRDRIYYLWNHLFYDVGNFLVNTYDVGHFKPPNQDVFSLEFPRPQHNEDSENVRVLTKVWETEVILLPAYLAPGTAVWVETCSLGEEGGVVRNVVKLRGKFSHDKPDQAWYIAKGLETRFYIEGEVDKDYDGLAAAMVYGKIEG